MLFIIYVSIALSVTSSIIASNELDSSLSSRCFKRISIGERLIAYDVTRIIERSNVTGCEQECYIYKCTHFSFGFTPQGNGTCELTTDREISRRQDSDFDLYQITDECVEGKPTGYAKEQEMITEASNALVVPQWLQVSDQWNRTEEMIERTCCPTVVLNKNY